ncbi:MAG: anthranilate synthase component I [Armatimonadetes bacterium]|nr:anthranilate synthase component I [Armatimonadota bacterium]
MLTPTLDDYRKLSAEGRAIAVYQDIRADIETPVSAYWKLAHDQTYSFLLESVTGGEQLARYSILGVTPKKVIRCKNGAGRIVEGSTETPMTLEAGQDPLDVLQKELEGTTPIPMPGLKHFLGGAVGMMAYDIVRYFEKLPDTCTDDLNVDDLAMMITDHVVVFDHVKNLIRVVVMADGSEAGYEGAKGKIQWVVDRLSKPLPPLPKGAVAEPILSANQTQEQFEDTVRKMKEYLRLGDGQQMVPSLRFMAEPATDPLSIYRALRSINPSPYMFLLQFGDFELIGASPEIMVSLHDGMARVRPIAGTRWRGQSEEEDQRLADELLADEKERAEHIMLVDLGRNDIGRVAKWGSVKVNDLMVIEKYSHVMHIVSDVTGELRDEFDTYDLIRATVPAGTVSGSPKVHAMELIDQLEPTRRGAYAGTVGVIGYDGNMDTCIALRTIFKRGNKAYVQAGCGVVYDSDPAYEYNEAKNKAKACLKAIEVANEGL